MHISVEPRDDYAILHLRGEFDTYYVNLLQEEIDALVKAGVVRVVLNLRWVRFINSTALGAIVKQSKQLSQKGGKLVLSRPSAFCRDILQKVGLDRVVNVFETDEDAAEYLLQGTARAKIVTEHHAEHPSTVLFSPLDAERLADFLPPESRTVDTHMDDKGSQGWTGAGRMASLDVEGLRFTWAGGNTGMTPAVMSQFLEIGSRWRSRFRLPMLQKGYCEAQCRVRDVEVRADGVKVSFVFDQIDPATKKAIEQYASDLAFLRDELKRAKG